MRRALLCFFSIFFLDFVSKFWVVHHLPEMYAYPMYPFGGIGLLQSAPLTLSLVHATNTGAAWGFLAEWKVLLLSIRLMICACLFVYLIVWRPQTKFQLPLVGILAGALCNIFDFAIYGHVIDMIYCIFFRCSYPVFNVADSAIFCSVVYLFFLSMKKKGGVADHATLS